MPSLRSSAILACTLAAPVVLSHAQTQPSPATPGSQSIYTLQAGARVVLTDVTVIDANGNPVHSLPLSAFHVSDNNKHQTIASFEEHAGVPAVQFPASPLGVSSNEYLLHLPPVLNVILIDIANLRIVDQMWLNYQLTLFLHNLPPGQPLAIYLRAGSGCFLVQNFTTDRQLLSEALHKAIPRIPPPGPEYLSDQQTLSQIAFALRWLPGRKNVLWFSGGSTAYLRPDATAFQDLAAMRAIYDELEEERIAVYPVDARGLTVFKSLGMWGQHGAMEDAARATGGQAFFDNNGLSDFAAHLIDTAGSFYTLTYSPSNFHLDDKWHSVRIKLDGGYHLSYRSGYFADGHNGTAQKSAATPTRLMVSGEKAKPQPVAPIIFQAAMLPTSDTALASLKPDAEGLTAPPPKKGASSFAVRYSLPIDELSGHGIDGKQTFVVGLAAITIDGDGVPVKRTFQQVTLSFDDAFLRQRGGTPIVVDQRLNLSRADQYIYLAVWDEPSGRFGELQLPVELPTPKGHH